MSVGGTVRQRGTCHRCGVERVLRKDGTLPAHRYGDVLDYRGKPVPCPGTWQTPESTKAAITVRDYDGNEIREGHRVRFASGNICIVTKIVFDHPTDVDPGAAWLTGDVVRIEPDGTAVTIGKFHDQRATRVRVQTA